MDNKEGFTNSIGDKKNEESYNTNGNIYEIYNQILARLNQPVECICILLNQINWINEFNRNQIDQLKILNQISHNLFNYMNMQEIKFNLIDQPNSNFIENISNKSARTENSTQDTSNQITHCHHEKSKISSTKIFFKSVGNNLSNFEIREETSKNSLTNLNNNSYELKENLEFLPLITNDYFIKIRKKPNKWTKEEDKHLIELVEQKFKLKKWNKIAEILNRNSNQCYSRYYRIRGDHNRKPWTLEEDTLLGELAKVHNHKWVKISRSFLETYNISRSSKQVRDRYTNFIDSNLSKEDFTQEEEEKIKYLYLKIGQSGKIIKNICQVARMIK